MRSGPPTWMRQLVPDKRLRKMVLRLSKRSSLRRSIKLLLAAFALPLLSCGHGPRVTPCVPFVECFDDESCGAKLACSDGRVLSADQAAGFSCVSPVDQRYMLKACSRGFGAPEVKYCVVADAGYVGCSDGSVGQLSDLVAWSCLSAMDRSKVLEWCSRRLTP